MVLRAKASLTGVDERLVVTIRLAVMGLFSVAPRVVDQRKLNVTLQHVAGWQGGRGGGNGGAGDNQFDSLSAFVRSFARSLVHSFIRPFVYSC